MSWLSYCRNNVNIASLGSLFPTVLNIQRFCISCFLKYVMILFLSIWHGISSDYKEEVQFCNKYFCSLISGMNSISWNLRSRIFIQICFLSLLRTFHTSFKYVLLALLLLLRCLFILFCLCREGLTFIVFNNFRFYNIHLHIITWSLFTSHCWLHVSCLFSGETLQSQGSLEAHDEESWCIPCCSIFNRSWWWRYGTHEPVI